MEVEAPARTGEGSSLRRSSTETTTCKYTDRTKFHENKFSSDLITSKREMKGKWKKTKELAMIPETRHQRVAAAVPVPAAVLLVEVDP